jgi:hypothetical protein
MLGRLALVRTDVSEERNVIPSSLFLITDYGGDTFLRNVGSYKSHTA